MRIRSRHFPMLVLSLALIPAALVLPWASSAQESTPAANPKNLVGTWHWIFHGQPFATMVLEPKADGFTGSVTNASIEADPDGKLTNAVALSGSSPIIRSSWDKGILRIVCKVDDDEIEWAVTLTSATTAEIAPWGAQAPKLKSIHAEKAL